MSHKQACRHTVFTGKYDKIQDHYIIKTSARKKITTKHHNKKKIIGKP